MFKRHELPGNIPSVSITIKPRRIDDLLMQLHSYLLIQFSRSEARRLIEGNAVKIDDKTINNPNEIINVKEGMMVKVGKRRIVKIVKK